MLEFPKWKYAVMFLVLFASALYSLPNLYPKQPAVQISVTRGTIEDGLAARIDQRLKAEGIAGASVGPDGDGLIVRLPGTDAQTKAAEVLKQELGSRYTVALNLSSFGGQGHGQRQPCGHGGAECQCG